MTDLSLGLGSYAAVFAPLEAEGRAETVTRRLTDAIVLGVLPDGLPLPPEAELAERMGVATTTVREALGMLRQDDLIRTRRGRGGGSFVRAPRDGGGAALLSRLRDLGLGELRDLGDHYAAVSGACAALAAERADSLDLQRVRSLAAAVAHAEGASLWLQAEGSFHLEVAVAAHSARLTRAEIALQAEVGPVLWLSHAYDGDPVLAGTRHTSVVSAIEAGDPTAAREAVEEHARDLVRALVPLHREAQRRSR
ncbi:MAG: FCD domain-containing protein [Micrococcales bacterium]|nr:FCD domain-containing protein [Micrococcales bacterium]